MATELRPVTADIDVPVRRQSVVVGQLTRSGVRPVSLLAEGRALWDTVVEKSATPARFIERMVGRVDAEILDVGCATGWLYDWPHAWRILK
jgi:2-polyprenyl-3-methyl-5-hydroxy-6-metoxy-1,4-benzoquinol methylase